jgi:hypothetical protein
LEPRTQVDIKLEPAGLFRQERVTGLRGDAGRELNRHAVPVAARHAPQHRATLRPIARRLKANRNQCPRLNRRFAQRAQSIITVIHHSQMAELAKTLAANPKGRRVRPNRPPINASTLETQSLSMLGWPCPLHVSQWPDH